MNVNMQEVTQLSKSAVKDAILELFAKVNRDGMDGLLVFLEKTDFFSAPASRSHHYDMEGGLAKHSLQVFHLMEHMALPYPDIELDSMILSALLHDLCKADYYFKSEEEASEAQVKYVDSLFQKAKRGLPVGYAANKKFCSELINWAKGGFSGDMPAFSTQWEIRDEFPFGHGEKSALLAYKFVDLKSEELLAIRWHAFLWEISDMNKYAFELAKEVPLVVLLAHADMQSCFLWERGPNGG